MGTQRRELAQLLVECADSTGYHVELSHMEPDILTISFMFGGVPVLVGVFMGFTLAFTICPYWTGHSRSFTVALGNSSLQTAHFINLAGLTELGPWMRGLLTRLRAPVRFRRRLPHAERCA